MSRLPTLATMALLVAAAAACQPQAPGQATAKVPKKAAINAVKPTATPAGGGAVVQPGQATPTPVLASGAPAQPGAGGPQTPATPTPTPAAGESATPTTGPAPTPTLFRPTPAADPTPVPSGYVSPLPADAFPTPEPTPKPTATPQPTPTPVPTPTPQLQDGAVLSRTIPEGVGELTGYIVTPDKDKPGEYVPVSGVTIFVSDQADQTRKAKLTNAGNGTYRLPEVALGEYYVRVEKSGYAADSAPTPVRIYPGWTSGHTLFLVLPQN